MINIPNMNFCSRKGTIFCGVFDGHGSFGHMVARKVRDSLPLHLWNHWKAKTSHQNSPHEDGNAEKSRNSEETASSLDQGWGDSLYTDDIEKLPEMYLTLKQSLLKAFKLMDAELKLNRAIDCFGSGTTAVTLIKQGQDLVIANVGDSRAVLGTRDKNNALVAIQLTVDLKPNLPREAARIRQCNGRVYASEDEPEVARLWLPDHDSPGLAITRAFGDFCMKDFGLISVPDVSYHRLTERDEFIILATDGVWDVLSNKEAVDIVASASSHATAAGAVVHCASQAWRLKSPTVKGDDCTVVCLFLGQSLSNKDQGCILKKFSKEAKYEVVSISNNREVAYEKSQGMVANPACMAVSKLKNEKLPDRYQSTRSFSECISTKHDEWSAL